MGGGAAATRIRPPPACDRLWCYCIDSSRLRGSPMRIVHPGNVEQRGPASILTPEATERRTGKYCGPSGEYFSGTGRGSAAGCGDMPASGSPRELIMPGSPNELEYA